jgi:hypothetical protein
MVERYRQGVGVESAPLQDEVILFHLLRQERFTGLVPQGAVA